MLFVLANICAISAADYLSSTITFPSSSITGHPYSCLLPNILVIIPHSLVVGVFLPSDSRYFLQDSRLFLLSLPSLGGDSPRLIPLPLPFSSLSVFPVSVSRLGGAASCFTPIERSTHLELVFRKSPSPVSWFKRLVHASIMASLWCSPLWSPIQMSVRATQPALTKTLLALVLWGILLPPFQ